MRAGSYKAMGRRLRKGKARKDEKRRARHERRQGADRPRLPRDLLGRKGRT